MSEEKIIDEKEIARIPNCLKNRVNLKTAIVDSIGAFTKSVEETFANMQLPLIPIHLVIVTDYGMIEGYFEEYKVPISEEEYKNNLVDIRDETSLYFNLGTNASFIRNQRLLELEKSGQEIEITRDGSFIVLREATLTPFTNPTVKMDFGELLVFTENIRGISLGNKKENVVNK